MEMHRFTLEPFDSHETGARMRQRPHLREEVKREERGMRSVYRQTALCALIVALLIVLELFVFRAEPETVPASVPAEDTAAEASAANADETEEEDALGRLQFVSGRVYSVFSSDAHWALPLSPTEVETLENGELLCLRADAGTAVRAAAAGQVVSIEQDAQYGTAVRIHHGDDRESVYYGLGGVSVEEGQPLLAGDGIGVVGDDGMLLLAAMEAGVRVQALEHFDTEPLTVA